MYYIMILAVLKFLILIENSKINIQENIQL